MPYKIHTFLYGPGSPNTDLFLMINQAHHPLLDPVMRWLIQLGSPKMFLVYLTVVGIVFLANRKKMPFSYIVVFALSTVVAILLERGLKGFFQVPRPVAALGLDDVRVLGQVLLKNALPSGHATFAAVLASSLGWHRDWRWKLPLWLFVALVCWSRIYVGAHYPLDVVAGVLVGAFAGISGWLMWERFSPKQGKRGR